MSFCFSVIYDPQRQDNEEKSADLFGEFASEIQMDDTDRQLVINWILLTKTHSTPEHKVESQDVGDKHYFIDLDMAILGSLPQGISFKSNHQLLQHSTTYENFVQSSNMSWESHRWTAGLGHSNRIQPSKFCVLVLFHKDYFSTLISVYCITYCVEPGILVWNSCKLNAKKKKYI